jgi:hypothetical protein
MYEGEMKNDEFNGYGTHTWANGTRYYKGEFKNNRRHGNGKSVYENGDIYED